VSEVERKGVGAQVAAADPKSSVWVGANAGTGKTHVLTDRITRLLLSDAKPGRVLCLTFTKAAAAEMATRLSERLGAWAVATDADLQAALRDLLGKPYEGDLKRARRLFATCLEFPGGLKIQTIHAFCQSILARFPLEAGLNPNQRVMDDRTRAELLLEARDRLLVGGGNESRLVEATDKIAALVDEEGFTRVMEELSGNRAKFETLHRAHGTTAAIGAALRKKLEIPTGAREETIIADARRCDEAALRPAAEVLLDGSKTDRRIGQIVVDWLDNPEARIRTFRDYAGAYLVNDLGKPRDKMMTKGLAEKHPGAHEVLKREQDRIAAAVERVRAVRLAEATEALLVLAGGLSECYSSLKRRRGLLDYDDLILATLDLLRAEGGANWVLYKLDGGLDHILVDEAQDTSAEQWAVVEALASEFFSGGGGTNKNHARTLFVVGDEKQSIYSFQGADPEGFERMRKIFARRLRDIGDRLVEVELALSFRSAPTIVRAVDAVFARTKLTGDGRSVPHRSNRDGQASMLELWPPVKKSDTPSDSPWDAPLDRIDSRSPESRVAERIADTIKGWIDDGETLDSRARPVRPGDILILVRKRGQFAARAIRALKERNIPVSGADRMVLTEQLVIRDLMAAADFALLPEDDLTLAALLKSPIVGLTEDQLFAVAHDRGGNGLWRSLRSAARTDATLAAAETQLKAIMARADRMPPYEFFEELLVADRARERLIAWLGPDAADPLDEFLGLALSFERDRAPSLQSFLHWLRAGSSEIKRDMERGGGEVRVMTVHGSKGLQGDIVILADACRERRAGTKPQLVWDLEDAENPCVYWPVARENEVGPVAERRAVMDDMAEREYRRLLYVAMTRARDRLYVTGWHGGENYKAGCWYDLIASALEPNLADVETPQGPARRLAAPQTGKPDGAENIGAASEIPSLPAWALTPAPAEPKPAIPLIPSTPEKEPPILGPFDRDDPSRFKRGRLIHRLLQSLPDMAMELQEEAALRLLSAHGVSTTEARSWIAETLGIIRHPDLSALFGRGSLAEAPIVGIVEDRVISARIDRLVVLDDRVMIVDYKTNRPPPRDIDDIPSVYRRQMESYRKLVHGLYPDKRIEEFLIWTDGPRFVALSENAGRG